MSTVHLKRIIPRIIVTACFLLGILCLSPSAFAPVSTENVHSRISNGPTVIIDAGHGGSDPGKVGVAGTEEKDLNLTIALLLKSLLEASDVQVIMTRETDEELGDDPSNRKLSDLKKRISIITGAEPAAVVSIHQNSYTSPDIYGAQCFYYTDSEEGKQLAGLLQQQIILSTEQTKIREIKANSDYYLLKKSQPPTVIVECGFLSNPGEEQLLNDPAYQRKMAWAIHLGVLQFLNGLSQNK